MATYEVLRNAIKKVPVGQHVELTDQEAKARGPKYVRRVEKTKKKQNTETETRKEEKAKEAEKTGEEKKKKQEQTQNKAAPKTTTNKTVK